MDGGGPVSDARLEAPGFAAILHGWASAYTGVVFKALVSAVQFWWRASAGNRLRPWLSPYLRWRLETYTGKPAATLRLRDFVRLLFVERRQFGRVLLWSGEMKSLASGKKR